MAKPPKGKNYFVSMCSANKMWLLYKMEELEGCFKNKNLLQIGDSYRCNTICSEAFTDLHMFMYKNDKRHMSNEVLEPLHDIAFSVWFIDGGGMTGRDKKNAYLNTTKFGMEGSQIVCDYFNSMGIGCNINQSKGRMKVLFGVEGTEGFLKIVAPQFPSFMVQD